MVAVISYNKERLKTTLKDNKIPERNGETSEEYIARTGDAKKFYTFGEGPEDYNKLALDVLTNKYLAHSEEGELEEKGPLYMWDRIARAMASVESPDQQEQIYSEFFDVLADFKFIPGGRIMHGAGRTEVKRPPTMSNCYVVPITWGYTQKIESATEEVREAIFEAKREGLDYAETTLFLYGLGIDIPEIRELTYPGDSLEGILNCLRESGEVFRSGGGVGTDLSGLRPKNAHVNSTVNESPGSSAFMHLLSESTNTVSQKGRRGALMLTQRVDHPDIEDFFTIKSDSNRTKVQYANISVLLTHEFMKAVENDTDFTLKWEHDEDPTSDTYGTIEGERTVRAQDLWYKIIEHAHASAEPGLIFWDTMREFHNGEYTRPLSSTNPCGEQPLAAYTACNLGNLNLAMFVREDGSFDYEDLATTTATVTRLMDNVIAYNREFHASDRIREAVDNDRRIGIGVTGMADALILMKKRYDSDEGIEEVEKMMKVIRDSSYKTSTSLAQERGSFPLYDWKGLSQSKFIQSLPEDIQKGIKENGLRNITLITMPPVGTGSIVSETTSGIEPTFATSFTRRVKQPNGETFEEYKVVAPLIRKIFGDDEELPDYVVTAHQIDPFFRVKMQGMIQKYNDTAISSTINLPEDASVETVAQIYMDGYKQGLKGLTVYREGSREGILQTDEHAEKGPISGLESKIEVEKHARLSERETSATYGIETGKGIVHISISGDDRWYPTGVFNNLGPIGTGQSSSVSVMGLRLTRYLEEAQEPDLLKVLKDFGSVRGDEPIGFGPNSVSSLEHGFSIAWRYHLLRHGVIAQNGDLGLKQIKFKKKENDIDASGLEDSISEENEESKKSGPSCVECGSHNTRMMDGCKEPTCMDCGDSRCS